MTKQWHHPIMDCIAPYLTCIGNGITYGCFILVVVLLRSNCRKIIIAGGSFGFMAAVIALLKYIFFAHMVRPIVLVPLDAKLHFVNGVELLTDLSFPSGHAATIFTLVSVIQLLFINKKKIYSLILLWLALAVAYSRIYLFQHFYTDVYVGSLIGTVSAVVVYIVLIDFNGPYWLDHSIDFLLRKKI